MYTFLVDPITLGPNAFGVVGSHDTYMKMQEKKLYSKFIIVHLLPLQHVALSFHWLQLGDVILAVAVPFVNASLDPWQIK